MPLALGLGLSRIRVTGERPWVEAVCFDAPRPQLPIRGQPQGASIGLVHGHTQ